MTNIVIHLTPEKTKMKLKKQQFFAKLKKQTKYFESHVIVMEQYKPNSFR